MSGDEKYGAKRSYISDDLEQLINYDTRNKSSEQVERLSVDELLAEHQDSLAEGKVCYFCGYRHPDHHWRCVLPALEAQHKENERLRGRVLHAESFDGETANGAYSLDEYDNGVTKNWESLTERQKDWWAKQAALEEQEAQGEQ